MTETTDPKIEKLRKIIFGDRGFDILWRMSSASRAKAFEIAKAYVEHNGHTLDEHEFDSVCAEENDGIEVEWVHYDFKPSREEQCSTQS